MVSKENLSVTKRNGRGKEALNIEKIHSMVGFATEGITGVSASHVEMNSGIQFFDGIDTEDIQQILIKSANDLISLENPNYQYVAARLLLFSLRKRLFHRLWEHPKFLDHIKSCVEITILLMQVYGKSWISILYKIEAMVKYLKHHSLCT